MKLRTLLLEIEQEIKQEAAVEKAVKYLQSDFNSALSEIEKTLSKTQKKKQVKQEGLITTTIGIALALPSILEIIKKLGLAAVKAFKAAFKIPQDNKTIPEKFFQEVGYFAEELHHTYIGTLEYLFNRYIDSPKLSKKLANITLHAIIAYFLFTAGVTALKAFKTKNLALGTLEGLLTAIKSQELRIFFLRMLKR